MNNIKGYIRIPNIVANSKITMGAKYLYGLIAYWAYIEEGSFQHTSDEVCEQLDISINTYKKYLKELETNKFITILQLNKTRKRITPMVTESIEIEERKNIVNQENLKNYQKLLESINWDNLTDIEKALIQSGMYKFKNDNIDPGQKKAINDFFNKL